MDGECGKAVKALMNSKAHHLNKYHPHLQKTLAFFETRKSPCKHQTIVSSYFGNKPLIILPHQLIFYVRSLSTNEKVYGHCLIAQKCEENDECTKLSPFSKEKTPVAFPYSKNHNVRTNFIFEFLPPFSKKKTLVL